MGCTDQQRPLRQPHGHRPAEIIPARDRPRADAGPLVYPFHLETPLSPFTTLADNLHQAFRKAPRKGRGPSPAFISYLEIIYTPAEARLFQHMAAYPGFMTTQHIADTAGVTEDAAQALLEQGAAKNAVTRMGNAWCLPPMPLLLNLTAGLSAADFDTKKAARLHREFFVEDGYYKYYQTSQAGTPSMRTIPVKLSITPEEKILTSEEAHQLINDLNHEDLVLAPCPCRSRQESLGQRRCKENNPVGSCIFLGISALQMEAAGVGERVTKVQALEYFDAMHATGLVPTTDNTLRDNIIICLCCSCCCSHLGGRTLWDNPTAVAPSNFIPQPDTHCKYCGRCAKACPTQALTVTAKPKAFDLKIDQCLGCGVCTQACPRESLKLKRQDRARPFPSQDSLYKALARANHRTYL